MSWVWIALGWLVWLGTIGASVAINYIAGYQFGRSGTEAQVFAFLGVSADVWKALGPIFMLALWRGKRRLIAGVAGIVWLACFVYAMTAALGLAAQNRSTLTGSREAVAHSYEAVSKDLVEVERQRARLGQQTSPAEIEAAINVIFARVVSGQGTVSSISIRCEKDHWRTRGPCAEIAELRRRHAEALEAQRLDERVEEQKNLVSNLRNRGGTLATDPQADLVSRLSFGTIAATDVGLGIVLLLVGMIELISTFAPIILREASSVVRATGATVAAGRAWSSADGTTREDAREVRPIADIYEYIHDRITPDRSGRVASAALFADYMLWCASANLDAEELDAFFRSFNTIVENDLHEWVRRDGNTYEGFQLKDGCSESRARGRGRSVRGKNSL